MSVIFINLRLIQLYFCSYFKREKYSLREYQSRWFEKNIFQKYHAIFLVNWWPTVFDASERLLRMMHIHIELTKSNLAKSHRRHRTYIAGDS
jgi:hypothetical protein